MPKVTQAALLAGFALGTAPTDAAEPGAFNGTWAVELVTESGPCDARYSASVAIRDGRVSAVSQAGARVSGKVGPDGAVGLNVSSGGTSGAASGRLQAAGGAGTWTVSPLCAGRWTARRSNTRTAQAE